MSDGLLGGGAYTFCLSDSKVFCEAGLCVKDKITVGAGNGKGSRNYWKQTWSWSLSISVVFNPVHSSEP